VRCDASQILITSGSQEGLLLCAHVLLDSGERVWMEEPGYPGAHQALTAAGARLVPVPDVVVSQRAARRGISIRPLSACYLNPPDRGGLILGYGNVEVDAIRDGVRKLKASISETQVDRLPKRRGYQTTMR
jgi:DNA-binding transcriptional MocR family regulator